MLQRLEHLLGIEPLTREQITFILDQAAPFQEFQRHPLKKLATLRGKTVALAFFEAVHAHAHQLRHRGFAAGRRPDESAGRIVQLEKGRIADRYGAHARSHAAGWNRDAPQLFGRGGVRGAAARNSGAERGRRHARASHAGAARRAHDSRPQGQARRLARHDSRRHSAQPRGAFEYSSAQQIRGAHYAVRAGDVGAARIREPCAECAARDSHRRSARRRRRDHGAARADRAHPRTGACCRGIHSALSAHARATAARETRTRSCCIPGR